ncbi:xanthine dehydrogenase molybdopterin binding subunit [Alteromonas aestuariivivens]|uniref:Xanthine dehydrogenase molybdopterin binding subunit n=1 Tax=Alteromonas aestuariivivens TaxID=1938339 RepID=A0A3D8MEK2_9ALTE|nr:xanthine dehydrogenase molybdopterin binding subunit [Alteromonas aestuariivivens]RDV29247.1 xanthine dehydrogenase molybdopterin binding subunit [Alteromonas aestuariivivens]
MRHFKIEHSAKAMAQVGRSIPHESAIKQVCGSATYLDDKSPPVDGLFGYPVLAGVTCGRIVTMDTSAATVMPGVVRIITAADVPGLNDVGPVFKGDPLFAEQNVEFHSQPLLLIVATSYEQARKAARAVQVEYEVSPAQLDIHQAIKQQDWVRPPHALEQGNVQQALVNARHCISGQMHIGGQEHFYLEGQISIASPTEDGGMFVQCSTQNPAEIQHLVAKVLNRPFNYVTVEMRRMGGGFGGKETQAAAWACMAAVAAHVTGKTVRIRLARGDDFRITGKRHPFFNRYQVGVDETGLIEAVDIELNGYCGYSADLSDAIVDRALFHADNAYHYPNARINGNRCRVNTVSHTAFRGFGGPQGMMAAEQIVDDIAYHLGIDPLKVRKRNLYRPGRDLTPYRQRIEQFVMADMIAQVESEARYWQRREAITMFNQLSPLIKKGLSLTPVKFGISFTLQHLNQAGALVLVYSDGSVHVNHGGTEMGQGLNTKIAQIVAQVFSIDAELILVNATRTDKVPNSSPTAASSGTDLNGMAALNAANTIRQRLVEFLADHHRVPADSVRFESSRVYFAGGEMDFSELAQLAYVNRISLSESGFYATPKVHYDRDKAEGHPFFYFSHGVALSEVEIDLLTGENTVTRVDILHDVGNSINPAIDIGQIEGGFIQGMGWLTTEDLRWNADGSLASAGPATYKIPAIGDTPAEFNVSLYDSENPETSVFKSKAVGEPPFMLGISVWSAIRNALASLTDYRFAPSLSTPATPEAILNAVAEARQWAAAHLHNPEATGRTTEC